MTTDTPIAHPAPDAGENPRTDAPRSWDGLDVAPDQDPEMVWLATYPREMLLGAAAMSDTARHEVEGMRAVPSGGEPWVTRLQPPHPPQVSRAAGALITVTSSRQQAYMCAYLLADAGLLADDLPGGKVAREVAAPIVLAGPTGEVTP